MISDNKDHITYSAADIQRYWNGQLSQEEMHAMEKAALDDPFLADAMEGMGDALHIHDEQLVNAELQNLRTQFEARAAGNRRKTPVVLFRWWKMAAAALIIAVSAIWIFNYTPENGKAREVAMQEATSNRKDTHAAPSEKKAPASHSTATDNTSMSSNITQERQSETTPYINLRDSTKTEPGYPVFNTPKQNAQSDSLNLALRSQPLGRARKNNEVDSQKPETKSNPPAAAKALLKDLKLRDSVSKREMEVVQVQRELFAKSQEKKQDDVKLQNIVSGVVTDNKNNPLANAYIMLEDKLRFVTDLSGNFKIPVSDSVVKVSVSLNGYATQNFRLRSNYDGAGTLANNANNQIQLQPSNNQLNEVVATGLGKYNYESKKRASASQKVLQEAIANDAQPVYGWLAYEKYLETNKRVPKDNPNLIGEVVLSFAVDKKGKLSEFIIEKSLSPQHDEEAQRLVREGPAWRLVRGRKSRVTVIVRF